MGGGYIQLVAKGDEDLYLIGNPQITFFKSVFRQYTNFSMELVENDMQNTISTSDFRAHFKMGKNGGDLLYKTHLEIDLPNIKIFNKNSSFKDTFNNKTINLNGFPDLSRVILKDVKNIDENFFDKLPTIGKTDILYAYGEINKTKLDSNNQYFIREGINGNHNYNNPYKKNGIMYDYEYKWPIDGSLYTGGKSIISYTQIQDQGDSDYTHHEFLSKILDDTNTDSINLFRKKDDNDFEDRKYRYSTDNILLEYDELFFDLLEEKTKLYIEISSTLNGEINTSSTELTLDSVTNFPDKGVIKINNEIIEYGAKNIGGKKLSDLSRRVVATSGTKVILFALSNNNSDLDKTYSRNFISSIKDILGNYFIDNIFKYNNHTNDTENINSNDKWTFEETDFSAGLYADGEFDENIQSFQGIKTGSHYNNFNNILKYDDLRKNFTQLTIDNISSITIVKETFTIYIYNRYLFILILLLTELTDDAPSQLKNAKDVYKKLTIKGVIGLVYHGILRLLPRNADVFENRHIICNALRHVKEHLNVIFESVLNEVLNVTKSYHNKKILSNNNYYTYTNNVGHALLKNIDISIGNQLIDRQSGEWLNVYNGLHDPYDTEHKMIGKWNKLPKNQHPLKQKLFIPLKFWFCKDIGNTLPIVSLQYHDIDIHIDVRGLKKLIIGSNYEGYHNNFQFMNNSKCKLFELSNGERRIIPDDFEFSNNYSIKLWSNVIYLDIDERKRFSETSHEYLIEQIQIIKEDYRENVRIPFKHSVKTLYWVIQNKNVIQETEVLDEVNYYLNGPSDGILKNNSQIANTNLQDYRIIRKIDTKNNSNEPPKWKDKNDYFNYNTEYDGNPFYYNNHVSFEHFNDCSIVFNGVERLSKLSPIYYRVLQPYDYNLNITSYDKIYTYSFSLKPDQYQPSGSCNFSKIDNPELRFNSNNSYDNYQITIFAVNYNILRIMNGMGGLLYS